MDAFWSLQSPSATGAIAVLIVWAPDEAKLRAAAERVGLGLPEVGRYRVAEILGVDRGVVARWSADAVHLMPHGGTGVVRALAAKLVRAGLVARAGPLAVQYPESSESLERRMLAVLCRARSPRAVDLLLDQPRRWAAVDAAGVASDPQRERVLGRLIEPPTAVLLGAPNIGKSTLMNALAGAGVSIVADEPGTTRDHVGVAVEVDGLTVRLMDTAGIQWGADPGIGPDPGGGMMLAGAADLVLLCGDAGHEPPAWRPRAGQAVRRVALRVDLGKPRWHADAWVSASRGEGVVELGRLIRGWLVPDEALADPRPWRFWAMGGEEVEPMAL